MDFVPDMGRRPFLSPCPLPRRLILGEVGGGPGTEVLWLWFVYLWHPTLALFKLQIHLFPSLSFRLGNSFHTQTQRQTDQSTISYKYKRLSRLNNSFSTCNCSSLPSCTLTPTQPTYNQKATTTTTRNHELSITLRKGPSPPRGRHQQLLQLLFRPLQLLW